MKKNKRGFQMSFAWLFAILAGAFILFLAIYGVTKVMNIGGGITGAKTGKEIGILLNPLETDFESEKIVLLEMPIETRIYNQQSISGNFGAQKIRISQKNFGKWSETEISPSFENKYIFSEDVVEGKDFILFSKPFKFPFKVADLIYLIPAEKEYCFRNAPEEIEEEISDLGQNNLVIENCSSESVGVCFDWKVSVSLGCDIKVDTGRGEVEKGNQKMFYETDALMYAAIFSDKSVYETQIERLMMRESGLLSLYDDKASILLAQGCSNEVNLLLFRELIKNVKNSEDLAKIAGIAEDIEKENNDAECKLW